MANNFERIILMNSWLVVIPSINPEWNKECINSLIDNETNFEYIIVDNRSKNYGVSGAWNIGLDRVVDNNIDWLVVCSESVRFGPSGAKSIQEALDSADQEDMMLEADDGFGWHLIAFRRELLLTVGYFDEVFFPAYFEDNDYTHRVKIVANKLDKPWFPWKKFKVDASLIGVAQGLKLLNYQMDFGWLTNKYKEKWGDYPVEIYEHPYNDPNLSMRYAERHNK